MSSATAPCFSASRALMPRIRPTVARDGDLSLHRNAHRVELRVVLDQTVVHVDDVGGHVALPAVSVHRGILRQRRRRIACTGGSASANSFASGDTRADVHRRRVRHPHVVRSHLRLDPPLLHLRDDVVARARLRRRPGNVRFTRELLRVRGRGGRRGALDRVGLEIALTSRTRGRVPDERLLCGECRRGTHGQERDGDFHVSDWQGWTRARRAPEETLGLYDLTRTDRALPAPRGEAARRGRGRRRRSPRSRRTAAASRLARRPRCPLRRGPRVHESARCRSDVRVSGSSDSSDGGVGRIGATTPRPRFRFGDSHSDDTGASSTTNEPGLCSRCVTTTPRRRSAYSRRFTASRTGETPSSL